MLKKKTRKAIRKGINKAIKKHGPRVARHLATRLVAGLATYIGAEGEEGAKKLKKVAKALPSKKQLKKASKSIPGGKQIARAVSATVPLLHDAAKKATGGNTSKKTGKGGEEDDLGLDDDFKDLDLFGERGFDEEEDDF